MKRVNVRHVRDREVKRDVAKRMILRALETEDIELRDRALDLYRETLDDPSKIPEHDAPFIEAAEGMEP